MISFVFLINILPLIVHGYQGVQHGVDQNQDTWSWEKIQDHKDKVQDHKAMVSRTLEKVQDKNEKPDWAKALSSALYSPDRTIDLASLGIDPAATFDRLLSPAGIVNQFALSIILRVMSTLGYIVTGQCCCLSLGGLALKLDKLITANNTNQSIKSKPSQS